MNNLNKPLFQATLEDIKDLIEDMFSPSYEQEREPSPKVKKHLVYGIAGLAQLLGVCRSTACKIKSSGILSPAISQYGKVIVIDADLALELMKAKNNAAKKHYK